MDVVEDNPVPFNLELLCGSENMTLLESSSFNLSLCALIFWLNQFKTKVHAALFHYVRTWNIVECKM